MKVLGIIGFVLLLSLSITFTMDMLLGLNFLHAVSHLLNPFNVIEVGEYVIIAFVFIIIIGQQVFYHLKNKTEKQ